MSFDAFRLSFSLGLIDMIKKITKLVAKKTVISKEKLPNNNAAKKVIMQNMVAFLFPKTVENVFWPAFLSAEKSGIVVKACMPERQKAAR